ncbi:MAG: hypothetical protein HZB46_16290 [Solirubrobacterales bacterium]|nr:hypothetical protein [Solirubrobacterales bacterium]
MLRTVAVLVFTVSLAALGWGFADAVDTGTCASGGPYVVDQECPDGADRTAALLILGALGAAASIVVLAMARMPWGLAAFGALFVVLGLAFLLGEMASDNLEGTGWFLGPLFLLMGSLPLLAGLRIDRRMRREPDYRPPAHDELLDGLAAALRERRDRRRAQRGSP